MSAILIKPIVTEKMTNQSELHNRYGFVVDKDANKVEIKKAVEKTYGVSVEKVHTMNYKGKLKTRQTKSALLKGRTNQVKKAIVSLAEGEVIDFYSGI